MQRRIVRSMGTLFRIPRKCRESRPRGACTYVCVCVNEIQGGSSVNPVGRAGSLACPCPVLACVVGEDVDRRGQEQRARARTRGKIAREKSQDQSATRGGTLRDGNSLAG